MTDRLPQTICNSSLQDSTQTNPAPLPGRSGMAGFKRKRLAVSPGFMLIEVLVATALMAVGITAGLQAIFNCLQASRDCQMYTQALFLAQRVMSELENEVNLNNFYDVPRGGDFDDLPNFRWIARVEEEDNFWTRRIFVSIIWAQDRRDLFNDAENYYYTVVTEVPRPRCPDEYKK